MKTLKCCIASVLYILGDFESKIGAGDSYQWLMAKSVDIQGDGTWPWKEPTKDE